MNCQIREEDAAVLAEYARISIAFEVASVLDVELGNRGLSGVVFSERRLPKVHVKDYDALEKCRPTAWARRWDLSKWGVLSAFAAGERIGGCVIAYDTEGIPRLSGRTDAAVLWDLRVDPVFRRAGVGSRLFDAAEAWALGRECREFFVETQNINVPACRFYANRGCVLAAIDRFAYREFPDEVEFVWHKELKRKQ